LAAGRLMPRLVEAERYEAWLEELVSVARVKEFNCAGHQNWRLAHDWHIRLVERANTLARFREYTRSMRNLEREPSGAA